MTIDRPAPPRVEASEQATEHAASDPSELGVPGADVSPGTEPAMLPPAPLETAEPPDESSQTAGSAPGIAPDMIVQTGELAPPTTTAPTGTPAVEEPPVRATPDALPAAPGTAETTASAAPGHPQHALPTLSRRQLLKLGLAALPTLVGAGGVYRTLGAAFGPRSIDDAVFARYDAAAHRWGFVVDASACIGCGSCVVACKQENNVPMDGEHTRTWIERHTVAPDGSVTIDSPEAGIHGFVPLPGASTVPAASTTPAASSLPTPPAPATHFVPRLCMQCEDSPCTAVCPVGATFHTADGVVLVDGDRCIGCGYCVVSCPYGARYLLPAGARTPQGVAGVADKCTFCYHRITRGLQPACVDVCPVGARIFGDLNDPSSRVSTLLRQRPSKVMRAGLGTRPRVHYLGLEGESI